MLGFFALFFIYLNLPLCFPFLCVSVQHSLISLAVSSILSSPTVFHLLISILIRFQLKLYIFYFSKYRVVLKYSLSALIVLCYITIVCLLFLKIYQTFSYIFCIWKFRYLQYLLIWWHFCFRWLSLTEASSLMFLVILLLWAHISWNFFVGVIWHLHISVVPPWLASLWHLRTDHHQLKIIGNFIFNFRFFRLPW